MRRTLVLLLALLVAVAGVVSVALVAARQSVPTASPVERDAPSSTEDDRRRRAPRSDSTAAAGEQTGALRVTVIDVCGDPLSTASASVRIDGHATSEAADSVGVIHISALPVGDVELAVAAPGHLPSPVDYPPVAAGATTQLTVVLLRAHSLRLRVVDVDGAPLSGVTLVELDQLDADFRRPRLTGFCGVGLDVDLARSSEARRATSAPDGSCVFEPVPAGMTWIAVAGAPWWLHVTGVHVPVEQTVTVTVPVHGRAEGRVTDGDTGRPLAGASVGWAHEWSTHAERATTDADGRYRLWFVDEPERAFKPIDVHAHGYLPQRDIPFGPPESADAPWRADVELRRGSAAELVVTQPDGRPAVGLRLRADQFDGTRREFAETDSDGRAALRSWPAGTLTLSSTTGEWESLSPAWIVLPESGRSVVEIVATPSAVETETETETETVHGIVVDPAGTAIASAVVAGWADTVTTDRRGAFAIDVFPSDWWYDDTLRLDVHRAGVPRVTHTVTRSQPRTRDQPVTLVCHPPATIAGRLVDESGNAAVPAALTADSRPVVVKRDGRFIIRMHDDRVFLSVTSAGRTPWSESIDVSPASTVDLGDIVLRTLHERTGRVVDDTGAAVADAQLLSAGFVTRSAPDGSFRVRVGDDDVVASAAGFATAKVEPPSEGSIEVVLHRLVEVAGTLMFEDGAAVRGALVQATLERSGDEVQTITDDAGRFRLRVPSADSVSWIGVLPASQTHPQPPPVGGLDVGRGNRDLRLTVPRGVAIRGRVLTADGRPVRSALVGSGWSYSDEVRTTTGSDGYFVLPGAPTGSEFEVEVSHRGRYAVRTVSTTEPMEELEFRLPDAATIAGTVALPDDSAGGTAEGLTIVAVRLSKSAEQESFAQYSAPLTPDGWFALTCAADSSYGLFLRHNDRFARRLSGDAVVSPGETAVRLTAVLGVSYSGRVVVPGGTPSMARVTLSPLVGRPGCSSIEVQADHDGTFRFDGLDPAETYAVSVVEYGHPEWNAVDVADLRIPEGGLHGVRLELR